MIHTGKSIPPFLFFVIVFLIISTPAFTEGGFFSRYGFTLSGGPGFLIGKTYEIVYKYAGLDDYLSELQWDIKPLFYMGLDIELGLKDPAEDWGFFVSCGIKVGIPMKTGIIENRDWIPNTLSPSPLTHFSSHENHTKAAFLLGLSTGFSFPVWKLILRPYLNLDYMYYSFEARNGYRDYWDTGYEKMSGPCIGYVQHWILIHIGIGAEFALGPFDLAACFFFGHSSCIAIDDHLLRDTRFTDYLYSGFMVKPVIEAFFSFNDTFKLGISASYLFIGTTRGDTHVKSPTADYWITDGAGAQFKAFEGTVLIKYKF